MHGLMSVIFIVIVDPFVLYRPNFYQCKAIMSYKKKALIFNCICFDIIALVGLVHNAFIWRNGMNFSYCSSFPRHSLPNNKGIKCWLWTCFTIKWCCIFFVWLEFDIPRCMRNECTNLVKWFDFGKDMVLYTPRKVTM